MKKEKILIIILLIALACIQTALATSVDRAAICNIEGYPGDAIEIPISLESTSSSERTGYWEVFYKKAEGDDEKIMNITSWIEIEPTDYTLKPGESKDFIVRIRIPKNAEPGLYGATSSGAAVLGHYDERRTYIRFSDADASVVETGGQGVWSALRIPVSVKVLGKPSPLAPIIKGIKTNITVIILLAVIIILLVVLLRRKGGKE